MTTTPETPDELVEAGARALLFEDCGDAALWDPMDEAEKENLRDSSRAVLAPAWPHLQPVRTFATVEDFFAAEYTEPLLIRDRDAEVWQAWENDYGDWRAVRPRSEEDPEGPEGDRWRPVGPERLEELPFPIVCRPERLYGGDAQ